MLRKIYKYLGITTLEDLQALVISANSALEAMRKRIELHETQIQALVKTKKKTKKK